MTPGEGVSDGGPLDQSRPGEERLPEVDAAETRAQLAHDKLERDSRGSPEDRARTELLQRVAHDFVYHAPTPEQVGIYGELRDRGKDFASAMIVHCPPGRELSTALSKLEEAVMWANAGIARHG